MKHDPIFFKHVVPSYHPSKYGALPVIGFLLVRIKCPVLSGINYP